MGQISAIHFKPGLHMVVTIAEHASHDAQKRILRLSMLFVKYEHLRSLQRCDDQGMRMREKLKKPVCNHVLAILTTYMETSV